MTINGSCLCQTVRYQISGLLADANNCHCSKCQKAHGAAFGTYARVNPDEFHWVCGEDNVAVYKSTLTGGRCFCRACGSTLAMVEHEKVAWVTLGTVDGDPRVRPGSHVFVGSKAPWHEIKDVLPRFEGWPPSKR